MISTPQFSVPSSVELSDIVPMNQGSGVQESIKNSSVKHNNKSNFTDFDNNVNLFTPSPIHPLKLSASPTKDPLGSATSSAFQVPAYQVTPVQLKQTENFIIDSSDKSKNEDKTYHAHSDSTTTSDKHYFE